MEHAHKGYLQEDCGGSSMDSRWFVLRLLSSFASIYTQIAIVSIPINSDSHLFEPLLAGRVTSGTVHCDGSLDDTVYKAYLYISRGSAPSTFVASIAPPVRPRVVKFSSIRKRVTHYVAYPRLGIPPDGPLSFRSYSSVLTQISASLQTSPSPCRLYSYTSRTYQAQFTSR